MWAYGEYRWFPWKEVEEDLQWLVHRERVVMLQGLWNWRWYLSAVAFVRDPVLWCELADRYPGMQWYSWGWWVYGRWERPRPGDPGVSALNAKF